MEFSIKLHAINSGWSIVYIEAIQAIISKNNSVFLSLKIYFVLPNSADPDKMQPYVACHVGHHCLPKCLFKGFLVHKMLIRI